MATEADTPGLLGRLFGYDPAAAYGGLLTDQKTQDAFNTRALAAMAGAFAEGAMPVPYKGGIPFAATLGKAGAAAYAGQDQLIKARQEAAQTALYGAQGDVARSNLAINQAMLPGLSALIEEGKKQAAGGAGAKTGPGGEPLTGPAKVLAETKGMGAVFDTGDPFLNLVAFHESKFQPNVGTGEHDLSSYQLDPTGFPMWPGVMTDKGRSTAAGLFQITGTNWHNYAPPLIQAGVIKPDFSVESQIAVAKAMKAANGTGDWLPYNPALAAAHARGDVVKVPGSPASTEAAGLAAGGLLGPVPDFARQMATPGTGPVGPTAGLLAEPALASPAPSGSTGANMIDPRARTAAGARYRQQTDFGSAEANDAVAAAGLGAAPTAVPPVTSIPGGTNGIVPRASPISTGAEGLLGAEPAPQNFPGRLGGVARALAGPPPGLLAAGAGGPIVPAAATGPAPPPGGPTLLPGGAGGLLAGPAPAAPPPGPPPAPVAAPGLVPGGAGGLLPGGPPAPGPVAPPPAAPAGLPPTALPAQMPPIPTQMPPMPTLTPPAPTPQQMIAQGVTGMMALTGRTAPAWMADLARMPTQMALEQYKAWVTAQTNMLTADHQKQLDVAGARVIEYEKSQGALPADLSKMTNEQNLRLRNSLAEKGMVLGPDGHMQYDPNWLEMQAQLARANKGYTPQQEEEQKAAGAVLGGEYKGVVEEQAAAQKARPYLLSIQQALETFNTPGAGAQTKLDVMKGLQTALTSAGIPMSGELQKWIASGEVLTKSGTHLGFELARTLGAHEAQNVIQQAVQNNPGIFTSLEGNRQLIGLMSAIIDRADGRRAFYDDWKADPRHGNSFAGAATAYEKANPWQATLSEFAPYTVKTEADLKRLKLPPGTQFIGPDNQPHRVGPNG
jgi:hypothetical protein